MDNTLHHIAWRLITALLWTTVLRHAQALGGPVALCISKGSDASEIVMHAGCTCTLAAHLMMRTCSQDPEPEARQSL